jgi:hypothetical protein
MAAAYVVSETLTVEQFFERGAAIGIQMRQAREQGKPKTEPREWDDWGKLLLDMVTLSLIRLHCLLKSLKNKGTKLTTIVSPIHTER